MHEGEGRVEMVKTSAWMTMSLRRGVDGVVQMLKPPPRREGGPTCSLLPFPFFFSSVNYFSFFLFQFNIFFFFVFFFSFPFLSFFFSSFSFPFLFLFFLRHIAFFSFRVPSFLNHPIFIICFFFSFFCFSPLFFFFDDFLFIVQPEVGVGHANFSVKAGGRVPATAHLNLGHDPPTVGRAPLGGRVKVARESYDDAQDPAMARRTARQKPSASHRPFSRNGESAVAAVSFVVSPSVSAFRPFPNNPILLPPDSPSVQASVS
jgi:hypothetical protein